MAEQDQYMKPLGEEGRKVIEKMIEHHKDLTIWGLSYIPYIKPKRILDIGCGGGNALKLMSVKYPNAKCTGIDISEEAVKFTLEHNAGFHAWGRIDATVASVSDIPFPDKTFDVITAIETYFFWPDLKKDLAHVVSKLNGGGVLCVVSEQFFTDANREKLTADCETYHMKLVGNDEMKSILESLGLSVEVLTDDAKNWVAFVATKTE